VVWNYRTRVSRIDSDGRYDSSFNLYAVGGDYTLIDSLAVQTDGKVLVGGRMVTMTIDPDGYVYYSYTPFVTRVHADGSHDTSFIGSGATANSLALQPDGKILVGGDELIRLNTDGTLDTSFNSDASGLIYSVVAQSDGKVSSGMVHSDWHEPARSCPAQCRWQSGRQFQFGRRSCWRISLR